MFRSSHAAILSPCPTLTSSPADPSDLADAPAFALRFQGRKRVHNADEILAEIVAKRLVEYLERAGLICHDEANGNWRALGDVASLITVEFPAKRLYSQRRNNRDVRSVHEEQDVVVTEAEQSIRPL